ncbi:MAG: WG repeat-containing protein [Acutalibacteraceae bacterium]|nr:WG repeat-containing protein [Acutalibacteraceae bacterium]
MIHHSFRKIIGFNYDEAWPFNKYGVAVVQNVGEDDYLIDMEGNEIPGS